MTPAQIAAIAAFMERTFTGIWEQDEDTGHWRVVPWEELAERVREVIEGETA